jgi:undecaprenyl-phosphate galactose phosphotransferase/putative colanic acid biosynthesis UDP-glucose lipid carrier transferase
MTQMSIRIQTSDQESIIRVANGPQAPFSYEAIPYLVSSTDAVVILLASVFGAVFYHWVSATPVPDLDSYFALGLIASFIHIARQGGEGYYDFERVAKPGVEFVPVLICWFTTALLLSFFAFLFKIGVSFSRGSFLIFIVVAPIGLLAGRKLEKQLVQAAVARGAIGRRNIILMGDQAELLTLEGQDLLAMLGAGEINRFPFTQASDPTLQQSSDFKTLKSVANFVRENNPSEILIAVPWKDTARIDFLREQVKLLPVSVRLLPDCQIRTLTNYASSARQRVLSIEIQRAPLSMTERFVKRTVDLVLAMIAVVLFLPIMAFAGLAVKLDGPGPVVFRQSRKGFNGRQFVMLKFRTMTVEENGDSVTQAVRDDPRVTRVGRLLRASSIDELPQLINVLRGDMSLIGPRPHALAHDNYFEKVLEDYAFRHHVKPGMTGWAQVHGLRGATPTIDLISRRVKMDLWYINNWSLWLDVQILFKTFFEVLRKRNAY